MSAGPSLACLTTLTTFQWAALLGAAGTVSGCAPLREEPVLSGASPALAGAGPVGTGGAVGVGGAGGAGGFGGGGGPAGGTGGPSTPDARPPPDSRAPEPPPPPADFGAQLGKSIFLDGALVVSCPGTAPSTETAVGDDFELQRGTDAPLLYIGYGCTWKLDASGTTATFRPGQVCIDTDTNGNRFEFVVIAGRLTFAGQRATLDLDLIAKSPALPATCNIEMTGNATRMMGGGMVY